MKGCTYPVGLCVAELACDPYDSAFVIALCWPQACRAGSLAGWFYFLGTPNVCKVYFLFLGHTR